MLIETKLRLMRGTSNPCGNIYGVLDVSYHFRFVPWMFRPVMFRPGTFRPTGCFVPGGFVPHIYIYIGDFKVIHFIDFISTTVCMRMNILHLIFVLEKIHRTTWKMLFHVTYTYKI